MRPNVDAERIHALARELARVATQDTTLYLTGGSTAVIQGWRRSTLDVDLRIEPESDDVRAGTTQTALNRLERGELSPTVATLERILLVLGETVQLGVVGLQGRSRRGPSGRPACTHAGRTD